MKWTASWEWICDRLWPTAHGLAEAADASKVIVPHDAPVEVVEQIAEQLEAVLDGETERARSIDSRLISIAAMTPMAVTLNLAVITFLTSGRASDFTPGSVRALTLLSTYVAFQFLRALLAAVSGLERKGYHAATAQSLVSHHTSKKAYLAAWANVRLGWVSAHRRANNDKVTQMAVAQVAITNAAIGLVGGGLVILWVAFTGIG